MLVTLACAPGLPDRRACSLRQDRLDVPDRVQPVLLRLVRRARPSVEDVGEPVAGVEGVVAVLANHSVLARAARDDVVAGPAVELVIAGAAVEGVVAAEAAEQVQRR